MSIPRDSFSYNDHSSEAHYDLYRMHNNDRDSPVYHSYLNPNKPERDQFTRFRTSVHFDEVDQRFSTIPTTSTLVSLNRCNYCGYIHAFATNNGGGDCNGKKSSGDKKGGNGGDDKGPDRNSSSGRVYCENFCSEFVTTSMFLVPVVLFILFSIGIWYCYGSLSSQDCFKNTKGDCDELITNENLKKAIKTPKGQCGTGGTQKESQTSLPPDLEEQYKNFKRALDRPDCYFHNNDKCPHLVNYAGFNYGGQIITTRDTKYFQNPMLCRCQDSQRLGQSCDPSSPTECSSCFCEKVPADILIRDDIIIVPGKCWSFSGVGKILIGYYYPIIVTGLTIHHPPRNRLPPSSFSSAPKDFELWGYHGVEDKEPFLFGRFEYKEEDPPSKIYEVKNFTTNAYDSVQFNFLTNHGNEYYTAVYKLEVHGLVDEKRIKTK